MPPKDVSALKHRIVKAEEVSKTSSPTRKQLQITELQKRFIDPDTNEPIQVGEAVEFSGWDTLNEGLTWLKYYIPDTYKALGWGKEKSNKSQKVVSYEDHSKDGEVLIWVVRLMQ